MQLTFFLRQTSHIHLPEKQKNMNIRDDIGQLSLRLAKLGLQAVNIESSLADDTFRVVYINKNAGKRSISSKGKNKKTSS